MTKKNISIFKIFLIIFLVTFMIWNTGMFADDYSESRNRFGKVFFDFSYENLGIMIFRIPEYLLFYHIYHFVEITKNTSFDLSSRARTDQIDCHSCKFHCPYE